MILIKIKKDIDSYLFLNICWYSSLRKYSLLKHSVYAGTDSGIRRRTLREFYIKWRKKYENHQIIDWFFFTNDAFNFMLEANRSISLT